MHEVRESTTAQDDMQEAQRIDEYMDADDPLDSAMSSVVNKIDPIESGPIPYEMLLRLETSKKMQADFIKVLSDFEDFIANLEEDENAEKVKQNFLENRFANMFNEAQVTASLDNVTGTYTIQEMRESEMASPSIAQLKDLDAEMVEEEEEPASQTSEEPIQPRKAKSKKPTPQKRDYDDYAMMDDEVVERPDLDMEHGGGGKGNGDYFWKKSLHDEFMRHFTVWGKTWKIVSLKMIENGISDKD